MMGISAMKELIVNFKHILLIVQLIKDPTKHECLTGSKCILGF